MEFRLSTEVFSIPAGDTVILHAPLLGVSAQVNPTMAALVDRLRGNPNASLTTAEQTAAEELVEAGLLCDSSTPPPVSVMRPPDQVALFLTEKCNLRCDYCYAHGGAGARTIPRKMAEDAITYLARTVKETGGSVLGVHFHGGGEVTTEWGLFVSLVEYARNLAESEGLSAQISAGLNGVMSARRAAQIPRLLDSATVSLDGLPEIHDQHRRTATGRGSSRQVLRTLAILDQEAFSKSYGLRATVTPDAVGRLPDSVAFMCEHSESLQIKAEPLFPYGRGRDQEEVDPLAYTEAFMEAKNVATKYGRQLNYSGCRFGTVSDIFCRAVNGSFCVTPSGLVTACFEVGHKADTDLDQFIYGRYNANWGTFDLDQAKRKALLRYRVGNRPGCRDCYAKYYCCGDCPAKVAVDGGPATDMKRVRCTINRELVRAEIIASVENARPEDQLAGPRLDAVPS